MYSIPNQTLFIFYHNPVGLGRHCLAFVRYLYLTRYKLSLKLRILRGLSLVEVTFFSKFSISVSLFQNFLYCSVSFCLAKSYWNLRFCSYNFCCFRQLQRSFYFLLVPFHFLINKFYWIFYVIFFIFVCLWCNTFITKFDWCSAINYQVIVRYCFLLIKSLYYFWTFWLKEINL